MRGERREERGERGERETGGGAGVSKATRHTQTPFLIKIAVHSIHPAQHSTLEQWLCLKVAGSK